MKRRGFTIIELMVVIAVMGALLILNVVNLRGTQISARDAERKTDIETLASHLETFYTSGSDTTPTVGRYPSTTLISGTTSVLPLKVLVVGGGGGGGYNAGGGGGGGGYQYIASLPVTAQAYPVTVGVGGSGGSAGIRGGNGGNSVFSTITANGGGGGGSRDGAGAGAPGANGGSGGGGAGAQDHSPVGTSSIGSQGGNGGSGWSPTAGYAGGGGGGAGANGQSVPASSGAVAGSGGVGLSNSITGTLITYAGGGGGGNTNGTTAGTGGSGGGGNGGVHPSGGNAGTNNLGGGGGGSGATTGGVGGSGIVIISYPSASITATGGTITYTDANNLNSRSNPAYAGGYTIHTFTSNGTFTITKFTAYSVQNILRDLDLASITAPDMKDYTQTFIAATNNTQTTGGVTPQPSINQYVYQPLQSDGSLCAFESQECRKFNIYYHLETGDTIYMVTSKNQ